MILFACAPLCHANDFDKLPEVRLLQKGMPEDVASWIPRMVECQHFGGEDPYDKARAEYLRKAIEEAGCAGLPEKEAFLRHKYINNPGVLNAIQKAKDLAI
jgi:hypothetical protein